MTIWSAAILLFLVLDPLGNLPFFVGALGRVEPRRRNWVLLRELTFALVVLLIFLLAGRYVLAALQIHRAALSVSGGIVLFLIALRMVFQGGEGIFGESPDAEEPFIVPLAIPLVAGPSALATVLLLVAREPGRLADWLLAVLLAWFVSSIILGLSAPLSRALGTRGLAAIERLMGLLLTTVAVQMLLTGLGTFLGIRT